MPSLLSSRHEQLETIVALGIVLQLATFCLGQLPTPELESLSPPLGQRGTQLVVVPQGSQLDELHELLFSVPEIESHPLPGPATLLDELRQPGGEFSVSLDSRTPPGLVDVYAVGRLGISNPRRFLITSKPTVVVRGEHSLASTALDLPRERIIYDKCLPQKLNFYAVHLRAGEYFSCVSYATQIDSRASLNLILHDPTGRELGRSRAIGTWPAAIHHQAQTTGDYVLAIHDFLYLGGENYGYLLEANVTRSNAFPQLELDTLLRPEFTTAYSPRPPSPSEFGRAADQYRTSRPYIGTNLAFTDRRQVSTWQWTQHGNIPCSILNMPVWLAGDFAERDLFVDIDASAQQQLDIEVLSASLEQLTDPQLVIYQVARTDAGEEQLTQLAAQDDPPAQGSLEMRVRELDPQLTWTAPGDGVYRIFVRDNLTGARPANSRAIGLAISTAQPEFRLLCYHPYPHTNLAGARPLGINLPRGGTESCGVIALRRNGFNLPIEVSIEGLPTGVISHPAILAAGQTEAELIVESTEDAATWRGEIHVWGRALDGAASPAVEADCACVVWPTATTKNAVQSRRCEQLFLSVSDLDQSPLLARLGETSPVEAMQGTKIKLPIKLTRRAGGQADCLLRPKDLPPKVTAAEIKVPGKDTEAEFELTIAPDAPPGEYTIWLQNETKVRWRKNPQAQSRQEMYLERLQVALTESQDPVESQKLQIAIQESKERVEQLKNETAEKEISVWFPTTPQKLRIVPPTN
jgi:hypothetical protein